jgi:hypothetical protein
MSPRPSIAGGPLETLRSQVLGAVFAPGDDGYDEAGRAWNLSVRQHPAVMVRAAGAPNVAAAVDFARRQELGVAVQATGHGVIRPADDCLQIVTSQMTDVTVDAAAATAWVGAGAQWGAVLTKAHAAGLAPLLGSSPGVGATGYTLGGGLGWLARKYGLSADSVRRFEVVAADGRLLTASADQHPDLFWALRGGGGGFAIVTGMEIQLHPVTAVFGGNLVYPAALAPQVLPEEFTAAFALMNLPPLDFVPEPLRGQSVVMVRGCHCGPVEQGRALLQPWLDWQAPIVDLFQVMPFTEIAAVSQDPIDPFPAVVTGAWLRDLSDDVIATLIEFGVAKVGPPPLISSEVRYIAGALNRIDADATAFSNRGARFVLDLVGLAPSPEALALGQQYGRRFKEALQPHLDGVYPNFVEGDEARAAAALAFSPEHRRRLAAVKATYDPGRLFDFSYDIPPRL